MPSSDGRYGSRDLASGLIEVHLGKT